MQDTWGFGTQYDPAKFSNIEAVVSDGFNNRFVTGLGYDVSPPIDFIIEDQLNPDVTNAPDAKNHSQQVLTDHLLYSQFALNWDQSGVNVLIDIFYSTKNNVPESNVPNWGQAA